MKKLSECKTIKEIVLNIPEKVCYNISFWLISIYFLLPIFILLTNIFVKGSSSMYMYVGFRTTVNKPYYILNCIIKEECFT